MKKCTNCEPSCGIYFMKIATGGLPLEDSFDDLASVCSRVVNRYVKDWDVATVMVGIEDNE